MRTIKVGVLQEAFNRVIGKLKDEGISEIEIPYDLYNLIPTDKWQVASKESEIVVGSLRDDLEYIEKLVADPNSICTYVDFDRIASLLRIISEVRNPVDN